MNIILIVFALLISAVPAFSENVVLHPNPSQELATKWSWALKQPAASKSNYWIGYSIDCLMEESEYIGSGVRFNGGTFSGSFRGSLQHDKFIGVPLSQVLTGKKVNEESDNITADERVRKSAEEALNAKSNERKNEKKVMKEIAILFRMERSVTSVRYGNIVLPFDLHGFPVVWLGKTDSAQSLAQLSGIYDKASDKKLKRGLIQTIGMHPLPDRVVPFIANIVKNKANDREIRKTAVYALEYQHGESALRLLKDTIESDSDVEIRKAAVYAIGEQEGQSITAYLKSVAINQSNEEVAKAACYSIGDRQGEEAFQALTSIVRDARDLEVRKAALYAIGDHGGKQAREFLLSLAVDDGSAELAKAALYALADLLESNEGGKVLVKVHREAKLNEVRKAAIYAIADAESADTVAVLKDIMGTEKDPELRKAVVYAMGDIESDEAIDALLEVVAKDNNQEIRKAAIYALSDVDSPRAKDALLEILKKAE
jgi:HEAT repeat protein